MSRSILTRIFAGSRPKVELGVEAGQVVCPAGGVVDIEHCFACPSFRGQSDQAGTRLICAPRADAAALFIAFGSVPR